MGCILFDNKRYWSIKDELPKSSLIRAENPLPSDSRFRQDVSYLKAGDIQPATEWKAKLEAMTPEQRRVALAQKALEDDLAPWKQVRQIAADEKAVKTLAAIDKIVAEKQEQFKKKMSAVEKSDQPNAKKPKGQGKRQADQKQPRKKKAEIEE